MQLDHLARDGESTPQRATDLWQPRDSALPCARHDQEVRHAGIPHAFIVAQPCVGLAANHRSIVGSRSRMGAPLIFVPSLIALVARIWHLIFPILMLNTLIASSAISLPAGELRTFSVGLASAFILAIIGQGLRQRARDHALAQIQTRLDAIDGHIVNFLRAIDKRAAIVEESAIELAKIRLQNEARGASKDVPPSRPPNP